VPHNGDYSVTMQDALAGERFNLVGNPYPSPIDALAFIENANNSGSITGTLYFWRKTNGSANPSYCTWSGGGFVSNDDLQTFDPNDVIQTGQAFFVEATGTNDQLLFTNEMRVGNNANQFFRNTQTTTTVERNRVWLNAYNGTGAFSQTMIGYMTNASNGLDTQIDGKYINDGEIALSSLLDATPMAIQGRALPFDAADVVPMRFKATTAGTYTIAIDHTDGMFVNDQTVFLRDNVSGVTHNLNDGAYTFAAEAGTFDSRFEIVYQATLGTDTPTLTQNQVVVYATDASSITVTTGTIVMNSIKVFDIRGRLLAESNAINASQATLALPATNQVVLLQITAVTGETITKKFVK
jgi:membrane-bound inhibitor of C-type lysozyme